MRGIYAIIYAAGIAVRFMAASQNLELNQFQKQVQRLSQVQITALNYLAMGNEALRDEIYRAVGENPALEIVKEPAADFSQTFRDNGAESYSKSNIDSDTYQRMLENQEDYGETLQAHLLHQLNAMKISDEEAELCTRLIYNLDKNNT